MTDLLKFVCGLCLVALPGWALPPANDDFANATLLPSVVPVEAFGNTEESTVEVVEPALDYARPGTIWWKWVAPTAGWYEAESVVSASAAGWSKLRVFRGSSLERLEDASREGNDGPRWSLSLCFPAAAGEVVYVRAQSGYDLDRLMRPSARTGYLPGSLAGNESVQLRIKEAPPRLPNDAFANRRLLSGPAPVHDEVLAMGATLEPGEPGLREHDGSVWWEWNPPASGWYFLRQPSDYNSEGEDFDAPDPPVLFTGLSPGALTPVSVTEGGLFFGAAGQPLILRGVLRRRQERDFTTQRVEIILPPDPTVNDTLAEAPLIPPTLPQTVNGSGWQATLEPAEPDFAVLNARSPAVGTIWWKWRAPATLTVKAEFGPAGQLVEDLLSISLGPGAGWTVYEGETGPESVAAWDVDAATENGGGSFSRYFHAEAGRLYWFRSIVGSQTDYPTFSLTLREHSTVNDAFAQSADLGATTLLRVDGTTEFATTEAGETTPQSQQPKSVWFTWTAPAHGLLNVESDSNHAVTVQQGSTLTALQPVPAVPWAEDPAWWYFPYTPTELFVEAGTTYRLAVRPCVPGLQPGAPPPPVGAEAFLFRLRFLAGAPAPNDDFPDAITLPSHPNVKAEANLRDATLELGETGVPGRSLWWRWTAPQSGLAEVRSLTSDGVVTSPRSRELELYTGGSLAALTAVPMQRAEAGGSDTVKWARVTAGTTYQLRVSDLPLPVWNPATETYDPPPEDSPAARAAPLATEFSLRILPPPPPNDALAQAENVGAPGHWERRTHGAEATREANEPDSRGGNHGTVWYRWQAPRHGFAAFEGSGISVFTSAQASPVLSELVPVDFLLEPSIYYYGPPLIAVSAGQSYWVQLTAAGAAGVRLFMPLTSHVHHDDFADAVDLGAAVGWQNLDSYEYGLPLTPLVQLSGTVLDLASREVGEPQHEGGDGGSVWYRWTAPRTASFDLLVADELTSGAGGLPGGGTASGELPPTTLKAGIYQGASVAALTSVNTVAFSSDAYPGARKWRFQAVTGTTYAIAIASAGKSREARLMLRLSDPYDRWIAAQTWSSRLAPEEDGDGDGEANLLHFAFHETFRDGPGRSYAPPGLRLDPWNSTVQAAWPVSFVGLDGAPPGYLERILETSVDGVTWTAVTGTPSVVWHESATSYALTVPQAGAALFRMKCRLHR